MAAGELTQLCITALSSNSLHGKNSLLTFLAYSDASPTPHTPSAPSFLRIPEIQAVIALSAPASTLPTFYILRAGIANLLV